MSQQDKLITCPKTGGNLCYQVEISPEITIYTSLSSGFWTNSIMTKDSQFFQEQVAVLPELYKDLAWEDPETKLVWLPQTINLPQQGMIFANGSNVDDWSWAAVKAIEVTQKEQHKYPMPGKKNQFYKYRMDMSSMKHFPEKDFIEALSYIGVLPE